MGFRPEPTIYSLNFKGTFLDGLHVKISCCTIREYNKMMNTTGATQEQQDNLDKLTELVKELAARNDWVLNLLASHLVSWDLEDADGNPVPTTRDGIDSQERAVIAQLIAAWQMAMVSVPNPLKPDSSNGRISEEQSLGLGSVSGSPGS
jgi:hypothetical protein